ncbi:MAG: Nif3-like dinuclear metal center hexameric protein [Acidobacteria bacterium]|nr:MAG: Nif3-like dinuclear metal center hexameric protein [Acidobacteriota bacterium]
MIERGSLLAYLDRLLEPAASDDWGPNGLQVEGREEIRRLVTGVSACQELFDRAADWRADAVLVHHGLFWHGQAPLVTGVTARRVKTLLAGGINLLAYHLPLDRHPVYGNNALAARGLGLVETAPFAEAKGLPVGVMGSLPAPLPAAELVERCRRLFDQQPLVLGAGPDPVRSIGIVSGGAQRELHAAIDAGLDAFLTGEASEWVTNLAREHGIHYLACGHHATERLGVRALGEHLGEHCGLETRFIDVPNPV